MNAFLECVLANPVITGEFRNFMDLDQLTLDLYLEAERMLVVYGPPPKSNTSSGFFPTIGSKSRQSQQKTPAEQHQLHSPRRRLSDHRRWSAFIARWGGLGFCGGSTSGASNSSNSTNQGNSPATSGSPKSWVSTTVANDQQPHQFENHRQRHQQLDNDLLRCYNACLYTMERKRERREYDEGFRIAQWFVSNVLKIWRETTGTISRANVMVPASSSSAATPSPSNGPNMQAAASTSTVTEHMKGKNTSGAANAATATTTIVAEKEKMYRKFNNLAMNLMQKSRSRVLEFMAAKEIIFSFLLNLAVRSVGYRSMLIEQQQQWQEEEEERRGVREPHDRRQKRQEQQAEMRQVANNHLKIQRQIGVSPQREQEVEVYSREKNDDIVSIQPDSRKLDGGHHQHQSQQIDIYEDKGTQCQIIVPIPGLHHGRPGSRDDARDYYDHATPSAATTTNDTSSLLPTLENLFIEAKEELARAEMVQQELEHEITRLEQDLRLTLNQLSETNGFLVKEREEHERTRQRLIHLEGWFGYCSSHASYGFGGRMGTGRPSPSSSVKSLPASIFSAESGGGGQQQDVGAGMAVCGSGAGLYQLDSMLNPERICQTLNQLYADIHSLLHQQLKLHLNNHNHNGNDTESMGGRSTNTHNSINTHSSINSRNGNRTRLPVSIAQKKSNDHPNLFFNRKRHSITSNPESTIHIIPASPSSIWSSSSSNSNSLSHSHQHPALGVHWARCLLSQLSPRCKAVASNTPTISAYAAGSMSTPATPLTTNHSKMEMIYAFEFVLSLFFLSLVEEPVGIPMVDCIATVRTELARLLSPTPSPTWTASDRPPTPEKHLLDDLQDDPDFSFSAYNYTFSTNGSGVGRSTPNNVPSAPSTTTHIHQGAIYTVMAAERQVNEIAAQEFEKIVGDEVVSGHGDDFREQDVDLLKGNGADSASTVSNGVNESKNGISARDFGTYSSCPTSTRTPTLTSTTADLGSTPSTTAQKWKTFLNIKKSQLADLLDFFLSSSNSFHSSQGLSTSLIPPSKLSALVTTMIHLRLAITACGFELAFPAPVVSKSRSATIDPRSNSLLRAPPSVTTLYDRTATTPNSGHGALPEAGRIDLGALDAVVSAMLPISLPTDSKTDSIKSGGGGGRISKMTARRDRTNGTLGRAHSSSSTESSGTAVRGGRGRWSVGGSTYSNTTSNTHRNSIANTGTSTSAMKGYTLAMSLLSTYLNNSTSPTTPTPPQPPLFNPSTMNPKCPLGIVSKPRRSTWSPATTSSTYQTAPEELQEEEQVGGLEDEEGSLEYR
ncbi:hypothetical protein HK102_005601, partial [Quaeritorhiza haematococci]